MLKICSHTAARSQLPIAGRTGWGDWAGERDVADRTGGQVRKFDGAGTWADGTDEMAARTRWSISFELS